MKKGCMFNKLTIVCLIIVIGSFLFMLIKMWPSPPFPESERYGCYYNPYNDIYLSFYDDEKNNDYQYVVFTKNDKRPVVFSSERKKFSPISSDYIKIEKSFDSNFFVFFFKDSTGRNNILCPSEDFLGNKIISVHSNDFIIDTLSRLFHNEMYGRIRFVGLSRFSVYTSVLRYKNRIVEIFRGIYPSIMQFSD